MDFSLLPHTTLIFGNDLVPLVVPLSSSVELARYRTAKARRDAANIREAAGAVALNLTNQVLMSAFGGKADIV